MEVKALTMPDELLQPDGLPARPSQPYAKEKLYYVERYQQIFATGMKRRWQHRVYLDLMAGSGRCQFADGTQVAGSPIRALAADFTGRVFVEQDIELVAALKTRVSDSRTEIIQGDCNDEAVIARLRAAVPTDGLGLAFIDNLGANVRFATVASLTRDRRIDLLVVFQLQDFTRNIGDALSGHDDPARFDAYFGTPEWRSIAERLRRANRPSSEIANHLMRHYIERLDTIGYAYAAGGDAVMKNSRNATQYRLLIASRHRRAVEFFQKIEQIDYGGQRSLFP